MRTKVDKQISSFKVRIDYSKNFQYKMYLPPPHYQKNFLCRFGWFRTMKKNNKFGVGLRPSTYLGCRKPTPFFFLMKPSLMHYWFWLCSEVFWPPFSTTQSNLLTCNCNYNDLHLIILIFCVFLFSKASKTFFDNLICKE